ncbi:MAG: type I methionyl aminopeptidase [Planctomycetota bacterium]
MKSAREIDIMREAGRIAGEALMRMGELVRPGVTTLELDQEAERTILSQAATCEFNGYHGFPANVCSSVNEQVVHGIPSKKIVLKEGDIVGLDVGARYRNYIGDTARTFPVGEVGDDVRALLDVTEKCLYAAIEVIGPGRKLWEVSESVQKLAEKHGYGLVREYAGHGIGTRMHEDPQVPNYVDMSSRYAELTLRPGMVICVEPMLNLGVSDVDVLDDGWTVVTADRKMSAHFEHTIAVTEDGAEILTKVG